MKIRIFLIKINNQPNPIRIKFKHFKNQKLSKTMNIIFIGTYDCC